MFVKKASVKDDSMDSAPIVPMVVPALNNIRISDRMVFKELQIMNTGKAVGLDGISGFILKNCAHRALPNFVPSL